MKRSVTNQASHLTEDAGRVPNVFHLALLPAQFFCINSPETRKCVDAAIRPASAEQPGTRGLATGEVLSLEIEIKFRRDREIQEAGRLG